MNYDKIAKSLAIDRKKDELAATTLNSLLGEGAADVSRLHALIAGKDAIVFGCGPSLKEDILLIKSKKLQKRMAIIAADGAAKALLEEKITPDVIVTDLDGDINSLLSSAKRKSFFVVHAHGDNINKLKSFLPKLLYYSSERTIGTTQTEPMGKIHNFGGFTDGDRAVFIAENFGAENIVLAGMDFGTKIGPYSETRDPKKKLIKLKKLKIAKKLISDLSCESHAAILNITSRGERIPNVPRISLDNLANML